MSFRRTSSYGTGLLECNQDTLGPSARSWLSQGSVVLAQNRKQNQRMGLIIWQDFICLAVEKFPGNESHRVCRMKVSADRPPLITL